MFAAIKKSGKTGFAALFMLTMLLLFGGRFAEGYCIANDLEQAQSRVFQAIKRIVEASPLLKREARITADKIIFAAFHQCHHHHGRQRLRRRGRRQPDDQLLRRAVGLRQRELAPACGTRWCRRRRARSPAG